jgi:hypothetical protein
VSGGEARLVTEGLITPKQWNADFAPASIKAFKYEETYVAFYQNSGGDNKGWVYDPRSEDTSLIELTTGSREPLAGFQDATDGNLYYIATNKIYKFQGDTSTYRTAEWKSKQFVADSPVSMSWLGVDFDDNEGTGGVEVSVWADGTLIFEATLTKNVVTYTLATTTPSGIASVNIPEAICRLPAVTAKIWEVKVEGRRLIDSFCIAQSIDEIKNA